MPSSPRSTRTLLYFFWKMHLRHRGTALTMSGTPIYTPSLITKDTLTMSGTAFEAHNNICARRNVVCLILCSLIPRYMFYVFFLINNLFLIIRPRSFEFLIY